MLNRRQFLKLSTAGTFSLMAGGPVMLLKHSAASAATIKDNHSVPDLEISLKATPSEISVMPGSPTSVWRYKGKLLKGNKNSVEYSVVDVCFSFDVGRSTFGVRRLFQYINE